MTLGEAEAEFVSLALIVLAVGALILEVRDIDGSQGDPGHAALPLQLSRAATNPPP